LNMNLAKIK